MATGFVSAAATRRSNKRSGERVARVAGCATGLEGELRHEPDQGLECARLAHHEPNRLEMARERQLIGMRDGGMVAGDIDMAGGRPSVGSQNVFLR